MNAYKVSYVLYSFSKNGFNWWKENLFVLYVQRKVLEEKKKIKELMHKEV